MMTENEKQWHQAKQDNNWELPPKAHWALRLPIIRHVRAFRLAGKVYEHEMAYRSLGLVTSSYDRWVLHAIWRGWC